MINTHTNLYESIFGLLGHGLDDGLFSSLISRVGQPVARYKLELGEDSTDEMIEFHNLGFGLSLDLNQNKIWLVGFEIHTPSVRLGRQNPFPSKLHGGIIGSDGPDAVAEKFGSNPISRSKNGLREKYFIPPYTFDCKFNDSFNLEAMTVYLLSVKQKA
jgi:hypothetical protein